MMPTCLNLCRALKLCMAKSRPNWFRIKTPILFMMSWAGLDLAPALNAIRLESSINRVRMISDILETNDAMGNRLTEDTVDARHISELDLALLRNPAFSALSSLPAEDYLEASRSEGDGYGYIGGHQDRSDDEDTEDGLPGADVAADPAASADDTSDSMFAFGFTPSDAHPPASLHSSSLPWDRRFLLGDIRDLAETVDSTNAAYELYQLVRSLAPQAGSGTPGLMLPPAPTLPNGSTGSFLRVLSAICVSPSGMTSISGPTLTAVSLLSPTAQSVR